MGGIHISSLPECLPASAVAGCRQEGEMTFVELIKAFLDDKFNTVALAHIPGISFWESGHLRHNKDRPVVDDLDQLPMPARDLLNIRSHAYMFTSRGCPYRCTFCASSRFWSKLRFFSAEYVVNEIESLIRDYRVSMISFFDDLFVADKPRLEEMIQILDRRQLLGKVRYTCSCRSNVVDDELAQLLAKLGVVSVGMGLESGDDGILRFLKGKSAGVTENTQAINILKKAKIAVNGSFIIGSPYETGEQAMRTYNFIRQSRLDLFDIYLLTPYPGTPIWDYATNRNLVSNDMTDWSCLDVNIYRFPEKAIILSEVLERKEVIKLYKKFRHLRFRRNLQKIINHPMMRDVPRMGLNLLREAVSK
jgi:anaerobic magnesium-protoporphyrin IX monomethyl ester cyclase